MLNEKAKWQCLLKERLPVTRSGGINWMKAQHYEAEKMIFKGLSRFHVTRKLFLGKHYLPRKYETGFILCLFMIKTFLALLVCCVLGTACERIKCLQIFIGMRVLPAGMYVPMCMLVPSEVKGEVGVIQMGVGHQVDAGNITWIFWKSSQYS